MTDAGLGRRAWSRVVAVATAPVTLRTPLLTTPPLVVTAYLATHATLGLQLAWHGVLLEVVVQTALGVALACVARWRLPFVLSQALMAGLACVAPQLHTVMFGRPLMPDDVHAARELLGVLPLGKKLLLLTPLLLLAAGVLGNLAVRRRRAAVAVSVLLALGVAARLAPEPFFAPIDRAVGGLAWDHWRHFRAEGPTLFLATEWARLVKGRQELPKRAEVIKAFAAIRADQAARQPLPMGRAGLGRNVHVIILEAFWDASRLAGAHLSADPFVSPFRALWTAAGSSRAMSPVAGGRTANAELEVLCGAPSLTEGVAFETELLKDVPCLPRFLAGKGYRTLAFHPNVPAFFNRIHAYRRMGFERYYSFDDFVKDDLNGPFLADESLYRQVAELARRDADGRPTLSYVVSISGHWEYDLSKERRPHVLSATSALPQIENYANSIHYSSAELVAYLDRLLAADPTALVMVVGDHTPALGRNAAGYVESSLAKPERTDWTPEMYLTIHATPLLILDGLDRPVRVGTVSQFEIPRLLLDLMGVRDETMMDLFLPPAGVHLRPLYDGTLDLPAEGPSRFCHLDDASGDCAVVARWRANAELLSKDLLVGKQITLGLLARK